MSGCCATVVGHRALCTLRTVRRDGERRLRPGSSPDMMSYVWEAVRGVAVLGAVLFLADRALLRLERRGWVYWRKRKGLSSIGADFMQGITPGADATRKAMEQERVRKNVRPAEEPPFHVDLDAGVVRIQRPDGGERGRDGPPESRQRDTLKS
jgi:hypothetical protein